MIGLMFLGAAILWIALSRYVAIHLPKWFGMSKPVARWLISGAVFLLLMVGPFVDHIVGMRQFQKLCDEQTGLQIYPSAVATKRGRELPAQIEPVEGQVIPVNRQSRKIIDLDTDELIAQYNYFSTRGGRVGGLIMLGGHYTCAASQLSHFDGQKFAAFAKQINLTFGETK